MRRPAWAARPITRSPQVWLNLEDAPAHTVNIRHEFRPQLVKLGILRPRRPSTISERRERATRLRARLRARSASLRMSESRTLRLMESRLRDSMLRYYDERALEHEEAHLLGTGTASIPDPESSGGKPHSWLASSSDSRKDESSIWRAARATGCRTMRPGSSITLIDQSARMLDECRKKAVRTAGAPGRIPWSFRGDLPNTVPSAHV